MGNQDPFLNLCAHLFFLLFFTSGFVSSQHQWDGIIVTQSDYQTLSSIKHELTDYTGILRTWSGTPNTTCSGTWAGILCSKGRITAIQVPFKGLGGRISPKIGLLRGLRRLSLHDNFITGTIPSSIRFLTNLRGLYLFNNRFSGAVPNSIGYLPYVQAIDISHNFLTGSIPSSLANSTRIYRLNLSHNSFSGPIPVSFTRAPSLTFLALEHNNLSGSIPDTWADQTGEVGSNQYRDYQLQSLSLDYNSFSGNIPPSLSQLASLKILSLSHNDINGSVPASFGNLSSLVTLNLENNHLDDEIPASLGGLRNLSVLSLRRNGFNGGIPLSIGNLSGITTLDLSENNLTGRIPASLASLSNLTSFNVSYNNLSGEVPSRLSEKFNSSSFVGNLQLCGFSSSTPCPSSPPPVQGPSPPSSSQPQQVSKHHKRRLSTKDIILILVGISLFILLLVCCVLLCCLIRKRSALRSKNSKGRGGVTAAAGGAQKGTSAAAAEGGAVSGSNGGKLVLFDGPLVFTADDLLCATAEIMGKSAYGTVYKASLEDGTQVAVKRLREKLAKSPKEFETEVASLGRIRHPNLLAMRAYYLGPKGEKLLVFDYMSKGSLSSFIHARGPETTVDWPARMTIAVGIAHGLQHLHVQENVIHGNLTSSEIYLDEQTNPKISDYGISRLMTDAANTNVIATAGSTGYRAPELPKQKKATTKTDIYSLGVIMLELLTGKTPGEAIDGSDLPHWVASTVKEEWTNEVFDLELMKNVSATGDEMLNTLKLALHLVDPSPDARPDIQQVIQQLEEINPKLAAVTATSTDDGGESHH